MMKFKILESPCSLENLENFRSDDGKIDLDLAGIIFTPESREHFGTVERIKNWVSFDGVRCLVKGAVNLGVDHSGEKIRTYSNYAEIIIEELSKELGVPVAHCDLAKIRDESGDVVDAVISQSVLDTEKGEILMSLNELIGNETEDGVIQDVTDYHFTIEGLEKYLEDGGYDEAVIEGTLMDYKKRLIFDTLVIATDNHPQNVSFILSLVNDKPYIKVSPYYDAEFSLMLENPRNEIKEMLADAELFTENIDGAYPRIGIEGGYGMDIWADTLDAITADDDELANYARTLLSKEVDMDEIFARVKGRIGCELPDDVKDTVRFAFDRRREKMQEIMGMDVGIDVEDDPLSWLSGIISKSEEKTSLDSLFSSLTNLVMDISRSEQSRNNVKKFTPKDEIDV